MWLINVVNIIMMDRRWPLAPPPGPGDDVCLGDVWVVGWVMGVVVGVVGGGVKGGGAKRQDFSEAEPKTLTNPDPPRDEEGITLKPTEF